MVAIMPIGKLYYSSSTIKLGKRGFLFIVIVEANCYVWNLRNKLSTNPSG
jgi:hypothetical protein